MFNYNMLIPEQFFQELSKTAKESFVNHMEVLKDILEMDYGALSTKILLLHCEWV